MADSRKFYKIKEGNARGFGIETKPDDEIGPMGWRRKRRASVKL
jgi:hypothetical protein